MRGNETDNKPPKYSKLNLEYQDFNYETTSFESIFLSLLHHNDIIFHTLCTKRLANDCCNYKAKLLCFIMCLSEPISNSVQILRRNITKIANIFM